jgi:hypothetical protein
MVMSPVGLGTKNRCAGEGQEQFSSQSVSQSVSESLSQFNGVLWASWTAGDRFPLGQLFFTSQSPDRLWGPSSLLSNEYAKFFPWGGG